MSPIRGCLFRGSLEGWGDEGWGWWWSKGYEVDHPYDFWECPQLSNDSYTYTYQNCYGYLPKFEREREYGDGSARSSCLKTRSFAHPFIHEHEFAGSPAKFKIVKEVPPFKTYASSFKSLWPKSFYGTAWSGEKKPNLTRYQYAAHQFRNGLDGLGIDCWSVW